MHRLVNTLEQFELEHRNNPNEYGGYINLQGKIVLVKEGSPDTVMLPPPPNSGGGIMYDFHTHPTRDSYGIQTPTDIFQAFQTHFASNGIVRGSFVIHEDGISLVNVRGPLDVDVNHTVKQLNIIEEDYQRLLVSIWGDIEGIWKNSDNFRMQTFVASTRHVHLLNEGMDRIVKKVLPLFSCTFWFSTKYSCIFGSQKNDVCKETENV